MAAAVGEDGMPLIFGRMKAYLADRLRRRSLQRPHATSRSSPFQLTWRTASEGGPYNGYTLRLDQAFLQHFFVAEPEVGNIGGAEAQNILERAAHFPKAKIDPHALNQIEQRLSAFGEQGLGTNTVAIEAMVGQHVDGVGTIAVAHDVQKPAGMGNGFGA